MTKRLIQMDVLPNRQIIFQIGIQTELDVQELIFQLHWKPLNHT